MSKKLNGSHRRALLRLRRQAYITQNGVCFWCHDKIPETAPMNHPKQPSADHFYPRSLGGLTRPGNIVMACRDCNSRRKVEEFKCLIVAFDENIVYTTGEKRTSPFESLKEKYNGLSR